MEHVKLLINNEQYYKDHIDYVEQNIETIPYRLFINASNKKRHITMIVMISITIYFAICLVGILIDMFFLNGKYLKDLPNFAIILYLVLSIISILISFTIFIILFRKIFLEYKQANNGKVNFLLSHNFYVVPKVNDCIKKAKKHFILNKTKDLKNEFELLEIIFLQENHSFGHFEDIDRLSGLEFEEYCGNLLYTAGFTNIIYTKASGDQGVDIIAYKKGHKFAIQCKRYEKPLGNSPIQEVFAGSKFYNCDACIVITNSTFTKDAIKLAEATDVELWDRDFLYTLHSSAVSYSKGIAQIKEKINDETNQANLNFQELSDESKDNYFFDNKLFAFPKHLTRIEDFVYYVKKEFN